ncbi:MAG: hypothetical protein QOD10_715 [Mycobacterium sp.]|jgi:hypothetical protein|nr:hypothetical protein [Mycobacterium sp.]
MTLIKIGGHFRATEEDTVQLVPRLAEQYDDTTIVMILSRQRRRTGTGLPCTKSRVHSLRVSRGIAAYQPPETVAPDGDCGHRPRSRTTPRRRKGEHLAVAARWLHCRRTAHRRCAVAHPIDQAVRDRVVPKVPEGWVGLDDAATILGVARQRVLLRSNAANCRLMHVNRGQR